MAQRQVLEGTWEEIKSHEKELTGRFLRVIVEADDAQTSEDIEGETTPARRKLLGYGMFAHLPFSSEDFAREKQEELDREERKFSR